MAVFCNIEGGRQELKVKGEGGVGGYHHLQLICK